NVSNPKLWTELKQAARSIREEGNVQVWFIIDAEAAEAHSGICEYIGGEFDIIRPLGLLTKREVSEYTTVAGFSSIGRECPWSDQSKRSDVRKIIDELERLNPDARINLFRSMENIKMQYLPSELDDTI
ncbi:MAG TPA: hypothetical protein P5295_20520, partial [Spirochaetota bacterium]|nr:hypothetical protein [Spirochaetota bacterium]